MPDLMMLGVLIKGEINKRSGRSGAHDLEGLAADGAISVSHVEGGGAAGANGLFNGVVVALFRCHGRGWGCRVGASAGGVVVVLLVLRLEVGGVSAVAASVTAVTVAAASASVSATATATAAASATVAAAASVSAAVAAAVAAVISRGACI